MRFRSNAQVMVGLVVGLLGILFTLQNFGVLLLGDVQLFWPLLVGMWLQFSYFGVVHISSYRPWPLVLVAVGGVMVWRGFAHGDRLERFRCEPIGF